MLTSKKMLHKLGYAFTPNTPEACEFKDRVVYITVPAQPYTETSCLKKSPNQTKNPPKRKKNSPQALKPIAFSFYPFLFEGMKPNL